MRAAELGVTMGCGLALTFGRRDGGCIGIFASKQGCRADRETDRRIFNAYT